MSEEIRAFKVHMSDEEIGNLKFRLKHARYPEAESVEEGARGTARWR